MSDQTLTLTLPEVLYKRVVETAEASSLTENEVLTQSIAMALPELESDLPPDLRKRLLAMALLSDKELMMQK